MLNVKKIASVTMAALMAVTVSATTLTTTAEAASHTPQINNEQMHNTGSRDNNSQKMDSHRNNAPKADNRDNRGPKKVEHKSAPAHRYDNGRHYDRNDNDNSGDIIVAGVVGLALGAIIANNC